MQKFLFLIAIFSILVTIVFAENIDSVTYATSAFCSSLSGFLPVIAMLMIIIGSAIYAAGQVMGAETRARANVWATASVTGAVMAILITVVAPPVLGTIYGSSVSCNSDVCAYGAVRCDSANPYAVNFCDAKTAGTYGKWGPPSGCGIQPGDPPPTSGHCGNAWHDNGVAGDYCGGPVCKNNQCSQQ